MPNALVVIVTFFIAFVYASFWYINILPYASQWFTTAWGLFKFALLKMFLICIYYNYYLAINTPPGNPPPNWRPADITEAELEQLRKESGTVPREEQMKRKYRFCRKCDAFKPPRAHHCSECDRCVLRMDHHCPWIDNCVGYHNHKYFLLFVVFAATGCCFALINYISTVVRWIIDYRQLRDFGTVNALPNGPLSLILLIANLFLVFPTAFALVWLAVSQLWQVKENITSVEQFEKYFELNSRKKKRKQLEKETRLAAIQQAQQTVLPNGAANGQTNPLGSPPSLTRAPQVVLNRETERRIELEVEREYQWKYDQGAMTNFKEFFGEEVWMWPLPILPRHVKQHKKYLQDYQRTELGEATTDRTQGSALFRSSLLTQNEEIV